MPKVRHTSNTIVVLVRRLRGLRFVATDDFLDVAHVVIGLWEFLLDELFGLFDQILEFELLFPLFIDRLHDFNGPLYQEVNHFAGCLLETGNHLRSRRRQLE